MKFYKALFIVIICLLLADVYGQKPVELKLKFVGAEYTVYKVTMKPENIDSVEINFNILKSDSSSITKGKKMDNFFYNALEKEMLKDKYFVIKKVKDNFLLSKTSSDTADDIISKSQYFNAYIDNKGNNLSFYLVDAVNDMIRLFFGLPDKKIKKGDIWALNIDLTSLNGYVQCDSSFKNDIVKVVNIQTTKSDTIVTLSYSFEEYFKGNLWVPTTSHLKYYGKAVFSLVKGMWLSYDCIKEINMTGLASTKSKEIYKLELVENYPPQILNEIKKTEKINKK